MQRSLKKRNLKVIGKVTMSTALATMMALYLPVMAFADEWNIENGDITINKTSDDQLVSQGSESRSDSNPTITGSSNYNNDTQTNANVVTITAASGTTASVTFSGLTINTRQTPTDENSTGAAAVSVNGEGSVSIELNGNNSLTSGYNHAGIEDHLEGTLTIKDADNDTATLTVMGGLYGAGIGGGDNRDGSNILITGGNVTATGGVNAAGIGGGNGQSGTNIGNGSNIKITGGNVTATGGGNGAGIGGGKNGNGSSITIENGTVTATGGAYGLAYGAGGAGIGGGYGKAGSNITIKNGTVTATGGANGAGIGGGTNGGDGSDITIEGGNVIAVGNNGGAGIGGGLNGIGSDITISKSAHVSVAGSLNSSNEVTGAAIGNAANWNSSHEYFSGTEVAPNTNGLYTTGSIKKYAPGTTADQIANGSVQPTGNPIVGTVEPPATDSEQNTSPVSSLGTVSVISTDTTSASTATATADDTDAAFFAAVDMQIDDLLREISALIAEGRLAEANALIAKGLTINAGTHQGFNAATLAKLGEVSRMGIAVTVNFIYAGNNYSVTIPGYSVIDPATLIDTNGYCGFLNLVKYFSQT